MCQAVPMRVVRVDGETAWIAVKSGERAVSLLGVEDVVAGDYLLVHAGLALARIEPEEADAILRVLAEIAAITANDSASGQPASISAAST